MRSTSTRPWRPAAWWREPDEKWGETPCAFVELKPGADGDARTRSSSIAATLLARFKMPEGGGLRRNPEDLDRQDPEIPPA